MFTLLEIFSGAEHFLIGVETLGLFPVERRKRNGISNGV